MAAAEPQLRRAAALPALVVAIAASTAACGGGSGGSPGVEAPPVTPDRRALLPAGETRYIHKTFHELARYCRRGRADKRRLDATTERFIALYRRFPADRFRMAIDDESGTTLSAILVLRYELSTCSPRNAARIDRVLGPRAPDAPRRPPGDRR